MRKISLYIIFAVCVSTILIIASTLLFSKSVQDGIALGASLLASLASIITMIVALLLYDKFGLDRKIKDYQTNAVIDLIEVLRNTCCKVYGRNMTYLIWFAVNLNNRIPQLIKENNESSKKLLFITNDSGHTPLDIDKFVKNMWLPEDIKRKLIFLDFWGTSSVPPPDSIGYLEASYGGLTEKHYLHGEEMTFLEYIEKIEELKLAISNWLKKNSSLSLQINLSSRIQLSKESA